MKQKCNKCFTIKDVSEFEWQKDRPNPRKTCKKCRLKNRKYTAEQRERRKEYAKKQRESKDFKTKRKDYDLKKTYGVSLKYFKNLIELQNNRCKICNKVLSNSKDTHLDHCHSTGKVRGILCSNCNVGLGNFKDNIAYLKEAIKYLNKHKND